MSRRFTFILVGLLAIFSGLLAWLRHNQTTTLLRPADIAFGEIHHLDFDPATGVFTVLGPDPFGYLKLPSWVIPLRELRLDFEGDYREGGWYVYPCPAHLNPPMINQDWVVTARPEKTETGHALIWTLQDSQIARIDFPDELTAPMRLEQLVLRTDHQSSRSLLYLGSVISGALAGLILLVRLLAAHLHHAVAQVGVMLGLMATKLELARNLGQTFMTELVHDDRLFMDQGRSILAGDWLGPFHELTLAKGPSFSIFLALSAASGWPLQFNVLLFHAMACGALVLAVSPWVTQPGWRILLFALLLLDPQSMSAELIGRVLRSSVHPALTLFTFAGLIGMVARVRFTGWRVLPWAILAGLAGAAFWYSREEGVWALPSAVLLTGTAVAAIWVQPARRWSVLLLVVLLPTGVFWATKSGLRAVNHQAYGVWMGVDVLEGTFPDAHGAILRVHNPDPLPGVPTTRATRELIYAQSPTFAKLREPMEEHMQDKWAFAGWHRHPPHERAETEIRHGWFAWALRDAAAQAGFYESAAKAESFWREVATEINAAVDEGRLVGGGPRRGFLPVWDHRFMVPTLLNWFRAVDLVVRATDFKAKGIPSRGPPDQIVSMAQTYHAQAVITIGPTSPDAKLRMVVHRIFHWAGWPLTLIALVATGVVGWRARKSVPDRVGLAVLLSLWGGITALALVVALVEATSFVAVIGAYLGPASPLLIMTWVLAPYFIWVRPPTVDRP